MLLQSGMKLPEPKKPEEVEKTDDPSYCPYHRCLGHTIENCITFQDLLERQYKMGKMEIPAQFLEKQASSVKENVSLIMTLMKEKNQFLTIFIWHLSL